MLIDIHGLPLIAPTFFKELDWLVGGFGLKDITIEKYVGALGLKETFIPKTHQPHGSHVHVFKRMTHDTRLMTIEADAFLTGQMGVVCWVRTADCLPILLVDVKNRAVGAVHAGWRSTAEKIIVEAIQKFKSEWKTDPKDLKIALGPAICGRCYRVGTDVVEAFRKANLYPGPWFQEMDKGHWQLDVAFANLYLLETALVLRENIYLSLACTACDLKKFHSFRKEAGKKGEQVSFVIVREY